MPETNCKCPDCPRHGTRQMHGAKCCAGADHNRMRPTPRTPAPERKRRESPATEAPSATMAPGWKRDLANRCYDGERPSRMNGDP